MNGAEFIFWICAAGLFHTYFGYPLLVAALAAVRPREVKRAPFTGDVSVLLSVFNDAAHLVPKLQGLLRIRDSGRIREILVGSDGSTDGLAAALAGLRDPRIRLVEFPRRRGKASVLNDLMPLAAGEIVVMTDARQLLHDDALANLLAPFADESIGVVSGQLVFRRREGDSSGTKGIGSYWSYEKSIRRAEARFSSVPGATGALYAIRRPLLLPVPPSTVLDDVVIPMQAVLQGARCIYEDSAVCEDEPSRSVEAEQIRKRRTITGCIQLAVLFPGWLLPWRNPIWFQFVSHKLLRLLSPFFLGGLLVTTVMLSGRPFFSIMMAFQLLGLMLVPLGWAADRVGFRWKVTGAAVVFAALNVTILRAWLDAVQGRFAPAWEKSVKV